MWDLITDSPTNARIRDIENYSLQVEKYDGEYFLVLTGIVTKDINGRPLPETGFRITKSSPIVKIEGNDITTESGTVYTLVGPPAKSFFCLVETYRESTQLDYQYNPDKPIKSCLLDWVKRNQTEGRKPNSWELK